jgi:hypothetical protein
MKMSHRCYPDVVSFAARSCFYQPHNESLEASPESQQKICLPHCYEAGELCDNPTLPIELNGWTWLPWTEQNKDTHYKIGKAGNLGGDRWEKDGMYVFLVNESEFSNVEDYDICVVADDRPSLEEFLKDFKLENQQIEETTAVQYWT